MPQGRAEMVSATLRYEKLRLFLKSRVYQKEGISVPPGATASRSGSHSPHYQEYEGTPPPIGGCFVLGIIVYSSPYKTPLKVR
jgi:hypothetical protein